MCDDTSTLVQFFKIPLDSISFDLEMRNRYLGVPFGSYFVRAGTVFFFSFSPLYLYVAIVLKHDT